MTNPDIRFYEALFRNVGFVLIAADGEGRILCWNEEASRMFGGGGPDKIGTPIISVFPADVREQVAAHVAAALDRGTVTDVEFKHVGPSGDELTLVAIVSPVRTFDGRRLGVSVAMRDITNRKRLSRQLAASRRMAALGNMASGVAHHFNNILAGMLTSIGAALAGDSPRIMRKTLERLEDSIGRASRITNQLLAFAKAEHSESHLIDLNQAVDRCIESLRPRLEQRGLTIDTHIEPVPPRPFETHRISSVLDSITQNAIDAMQSGGRLTLRLRTVGDQAVIRVEDTGCGIASEDLERLFEPFFTTKGQLGGGTAGNVGLGLAAVHGFVTEMGGTIELTSRKGVGTQVELRLPLEERTV